MVTAAEEVAWSHDVEPWDGTGALPAIEVDVDAVGHRVVHGGSQLVRPTVVDDAALATIEALTPLAPLHQPRAVAAIRAVSSALPGVPAVACFDTAFHATLPPAAATYALPRAWLRRWDLRRFGFHGLSHRYAARRAVELAGLSASRARVVSCHLGAGASLCAVRGGISVDTTMGFTPLEGLVMATRSGSVDPGLVLWLVTEGGLGAGEVGEALEQSSGLAGISGSSGDMREILRGLTAGDDASKLALDVYLHRLRREIAAMTAALGGLDLLVFTGGVGEHAPVVRAMAARQLGYLGIVLDGTKNGTTTADGEITAEGAGVRTFVVTAREDLEIARLVRSALAGANP